MPSSPDIAGHLGYGMRMIQSAMVSLPHLKVLGALQNWGEPCLFFHCDNETVVQVWESGLSHWSRTCPVQDMQKCLSICYLYPLGSLFTLRLYHKEWHLQDHQGSVQHSQQDIPPTNFWYWVNYLHPFQAHLERCKQKVKSKSYYTMITIETSFMCLLTSWKAVVVSYVVIV